MGVPLDRAGNDWVVRRLLSAGHFMFIAKKGVGGLERHSWGHRVKSKSYLQACGPFEFPLGFPFDTCSFHRELCGCLIPSPLCQAALEAQSYLEAGVGFALDGRLAIGKMPC